MLTSMAQSRRLLIVPAALAGLLLGGCAGDGRLTKPEYEEKVRSVYAEVQRAFQATDVPRSELADRVEDAQRQLREGADELDGVEPPEDVGTEHQQLVDGMRRYAEDLDRLRNAAASGDVRTVDDFNARVAQNEAVEQMAEAAERMKFKGYDLGQIAEE
jgi:outer membrane murein-binding lipoprotein Lpp